MNLRDRIEAVLSKWDPTDIVDPEDREELVGAIVSAIEDPPTRKVRIGECGVDSGQMMLMDPCYVDSEWRPKNISRDVECRFWGRDHERMAELLKSRGYEVKMVQEPHVWSAVMLGCPPSDTIKEIQSISADEQVRVMVSTHSESSYDECCDLTCGPDKGGQLHYKMGHAGLGVVTRTGFGDGCYPVFARIADCGQFGERVQSVTIEFFPEEDIDEYRED